jgi:hypothetical protein
MRHWIFERRRSMSVFRKWSCITLLILCLCLPLTGCGEILHELFIESREQREERVYVEAIEAIFTALDAGDADALYDLFSAEAKAGDPDLEADIARMMEVYEGPYVTHGFDGLLGGSAHFEQEGSTYSIFTSTPIEAGDTYYWIYLNYTYQCDPNPANIGITELEFFTADEWCLGLYDEESTREPSRGLTVYADKTLDHEWRCIYGNPLVYTDRGTVDLLEAKEQIEENDSYAAFVERFGEPAASYIYRYYPLPDENGEPRWLCLGYDDREGYDDSIHTAYIVDRFVYLDMLLEDD